MYCTYNGMHVIPDPDKLNLHFFYIFYFTHAGKERRVQYVWDGRIDGLMD